MTQTTENAILTIENGVFHSKGGLRERYAHFRGDPRTNKESV